MIINHNIAALNTHRQLSSANNAQSDSMEKLSSGLRINRAGDDAAGLAISEKMRGQIRGLDQASRNAQDGISLIQTAEGALNETHSILQRMRELAVQSSNDTNTETDREELQKEVDQLSQELSRIGNNTEFNTQNLLDGSFEGTFQIGANESQNLELSVDDMRGFSLGMSGSAKVDATATVADGGDSTNDITDGTYTVVENSSSDYDLVDSSGNVVASSTDSGANYSAASGDDTIDFSASPVISGEVTISSGTATGKSTITNDGLEAGNYTVSSDGSELLNSNNEVVATHDGANGYANTDGDVLLSTASTLAGDTEVSVGGIDISTQNAANAAITNINNAIETVSAERSKMGAYQNRLDHTINNLGTSSENLTAAESRIRDVDYALAA
ncbi:flagellin N-terminal helical domain-containing protein [Gracilibacillus salinarum]|uniref:Flagellin n=1 Tax=Gracilibacillus salinarum TaxID=2932255 RepID=A0ABY4GLQ4_9BACI|nr:flagellin [Gracilibacillus salinarum]UOQ85174.1 flagellin [Gracilibacillus salinarum]